MGGLFGGGGSKQSAPQVVYVPQPQPAPVDTSAADKKLQQGRASTILSEDRTKVNASKKSLLGE